MFLGIADTLTYTANFKDDIKAEICHNVVKFDLISRVSKSLLETQTLNV